MKIRRSFSAPSRSQGFTLLEMIVVLVIIGLIMGLVGPRLFTQADKAKAWADLCLAMDVVERATAP